VSLILNIETAVAGASICLSDNKQSIAFKQNQETRDSAGWLHSAIQDLFKENKLTLADLNAVSVSAGPGSYTGLRVGMATAKGLCFTLQLPLITIGTLDIMAAAVKNEVTTALLCPMIDARRMEVFTAVFDAAGKVVLPPQNMILDATSFSDLLQEQSITFFGNGSFKWKEQVNNTNAYFVDSTFSAAHMIELSHTSYTLKSFTDLAYSEPLYIKEFFNTQIPQSIQKKC
jgi:tRNA threonylcarbamoyladenosine biosynthesis protein TsaB